MRILIVDDNASMRTFLDTLLNGMRHDTRQSASGADAVIQYLDYRPDLVLMDIRMPGMDGIEAMERILDTDPEARVAMVTEVDEPIYRKSAERAGAVGYFLKDNLLPLISYLKGQT